MNKQELIEFENEIAEIYKTGVIRSPIHLRDGNEDILIDLYKYIAKDDYVLSTWANHLHALLKGIPKELIKARILEGESMAMNFPKYNFYTSAIVGAICPIGVGIAYGLMMKNKPSRVNIFIGDMCCITGIANECMRYSINYDLPITWIIEDNNKSVMTDTRLASKENIDEYIDHLRRLAYSTSKVDIIHYKYKSKFPHSGCGQFVSF